MEPLGQALTPTKRFWRLLKPDHREIRNVYVYSVFNGLVNLSLPLGIQAIVNLIQGGQITTSWIMLVTFVVLGVAITGLLRIFQLRITENLQQKIFTRAAFEFAHRIPRIKMEALYRKFAPELMNRFFDVMSIQKGLSKILIEISTAGLYVFFGLLLLSFYHPFFILFSLVLVFLVFAIFRFTAKRGLATSLDESRRKYEVAHWLEEIARTSTTFKLAGATDLPLDRVNQHTGKYIEARESHFKVLVTQYSLLVVFKVLVATGLLAIGGVLVMEQQMNIGQFVAAEIIIILVMNSVEKLIISLDTIYDILTALEKVGQVTDLELELEDGTPLTPEDFSTGMQIHIRDLQFSYPDAAEPILKHINLDIRPGEKIAIKGPNVSGKSTLLHIIGGMYDIKKGIINYDGVPKGNINLVHLRSQTGDCLAQEQLFSGSLLENITMGRKEATMENVKWAVKNLGLEDFISGLPHGYETPIVPQGKTLPRSAIVKLLLARSIAHKPRLLLLEDTFEHMEDRDRKSIMEFLTSSENKWTVILVSSDPLVLKNVSRVVEIENGTIKDNNHA